MVIDDADSHGMQAGEYREVRDIVFSPKQERSEQEVGKPTNTLKRLILTDEDFRDIREIQPMLLTKDTAFLYDKKYRGEEPMDGIDCWVVELKPRQILQGQRLFEGLMWVDERDFSVIRIEGQAVPQIQTMKSENLFPHFTTKRATVDGKFWFPIETSADDTLNFRNGPVRMRMTIRYVNYKRFSADSKIEFTK